ncbi:hypothetical protein JBL43_18635 [Aureibaculum sp. A20]|uniref:DUF4829 domain-containing protein n=1 Tax=Aureibaculum flavum TaxID=2795986 RepID=A0ABS0WWI6_9FLAO|nr:hypothetical protein [Aureibaculum flavum]MBJ2176275.1 hypothetical protein [Aureibaculum flavum]
MKKLILGLLVTVLFISCKKSNEIDNLKEFCNYTIACYKNDNRSEAIALRITKDDLMNVISSMTMLEPNKTKELEVTENRAKDGYFDNTKLEKAYSEFRTKQKEDFWKNCSIESYGYMETEDFFGFQMAEPMVVLKNGERTANFKIGELIKTDKGWKILGGGPDWK